MENRKRKIYWREEINSYLPKFNSLLAENFFRMEMSFFLQGVEEGKILTRTEYDKRFKYPNEYDKNGKEIYSYKLKPEAKDYLINYAAFSKIDDKIPAVFGRWVEYFGIWSHYRENEPIWNSTEGLDEVVKILQDKLQEQYERINNFLKLMNRETPPYFKSSEEYISYAGEKVLRYELEFNDDYDRGWFGDMSYHTSIYLESIGYMVDEESIDDISNRFFSSSVIPPENTITKYLDELKGISVQKIFDEKYGE